MALILLGMFASVLRCNTDGRDKFKNFPQRDQQTMYLVNEHKHFCALYAGEI